MFQLRDYQRKLVDQAIASLEQGERPLLVAPTGAGKSLILADIVRRILEQDDIPILVLCHRREIFVHLNRSIRKHTGQEPALIEAGKKINLETTSARVFIAMVPTLSRRLKSIPDSWPGNIAALLDEAHHTTAPTWSRLLDTIQPRLICGCTATPVSANKTPLGEFYTCLHVGPQPGELVDAGHLCPVKLFASEKRIDTTGVKIKRGDFDLKQAGQRAIQLTGDAVALVQRFNPSCDQTLAACCTLEHAGLMAKAFNDAGISAAVIDGGMATPKRDDLIAQFSSGQVQVLAFVSLIDEGLDLPEARCLLFARPTRSIRLRRQLEGRVRRIHEGKDHCVIVDMTDSWRRLPLPDDVVEWDINAPNESGAKLVARKKNKEVIRDPKTGQVKVVTITAARFAEIQRGRNAWRETPRVIEALSSKDGQVDHSYFSFLRRNRFARRGALKGFTAHEGATLEQFHEVGKLLRFSPYWAERAYEDAVGQSSRTKRAIHRHEALERQLLLAVRQAIAAGELRKETLDGRLRFVGVRGIDLVLKVECRVPDESKDLVRDRLTRAIETRLTPWRLTVLGLQPSLEAQHRAQVDRLFG